MPWNADIPEIYFAINISAYDFIFVNLIYDYNGLLVREITAMAQDILILFDTSKSL